MGAGLARRVAAVRNPAGAGEEQRVGPEPGGEDVRVGLGDFPEFDGQIGIDGRQTGDGLLQSEAIGGPLILGKGLDGPVKRHLSRRVGRQGGEDSGSIADPRPERRAPGEMRPGGRPEARARASPSPSLRLVDSRPGAEGPLILLRIGPRCVESRSLSLAFARAEITMISSAREAGPWPQA